MYNLQHGLVILAHVRTISLWFPYKNPFAILNRGSECHLLHDQCAWVLLFFVLFFWLYCIHKVRILTSRKRRWCWDLFHNFINLRVLPKNWATIFLSGTKLKKKKSRNNIFVSVCLWFFKGLVTCENAALKSEILELGS